MQSKMKRNNVLLRRGKEHQLNFSLSLSLHLCFCRRKCWNDLVNSSFPENVLSPSFHLSNPHSPLPPHFYSPRAGAWIQFLSSFFLSSFFILVLSAWEGVESGIEWFFLLTQISHTKNCYDFKFEPLMLEWNVGDKIRHSNIWIWKRVTVSKRMRMEKSYYLRMEWGRMERVESGWLIGKGIERKEERVMEVWWWVK